MRFAAPSRPTICAPSSRPRAALGDDLHRDRLPRRGSSPRVSSPRSCAVTQSKPGSCASRSVSPCARPRTSQTFVTAVPIDAGKRRVATGGVDRRRPDPACSRACRARSRPARPVMRWWVSTQSPAAHTPSALVAMRGRRSTIPPRRRRSRCRRRAASATFGCTPSPSTTTSAGSVPSPVTTARTRPSSSLSNASTALAEVQVDAEAADRVGDERAHVGIERAHRLRCASTTSTVEPAAQQRLGHLEPDVATAHHDRTRRRRRSSTTRRAARCRRRASGSRSTPARRCPGASGRIGVAPVAITSWSNGFDRARAPRSRSRTRDACARSSVDRDDFVAQCARRCRCRGAPRASARSGRRRRGRRSPTKYGIPHAEYDV